MLARHLAFKADIDPAPIARRDHELCANEPSVRRILLRGRSDQVSVRREREEQLSAAARGDVVETCLYRRGVVRDAVALRAEVAHREPPLRRLLGEQLRINRSKRAAHDGQKTQAKEKLAFHVTTGQLRGRPRDSRD